MSGPGMRMLTFFHTADWHLGQLLHGFDRDFEHVAFLEWLLKQLQEQRPDALLVAGDVFDSINPSAVSQKRFFSFLAEAHAALPSLQIVITAGNHDAAARLEAPAQVLASLNVTVVGTVSRSEQGEIELQKFLVPLRDESGTIQAIVLAVPFLRPSDVPLVADAADPYLEGIREFYRMLTQSAREMRSQLYPDAALIAMGHCHLSGGEESSDSERRMVIGGAEAVSPGIFDPDIAYVALGHLHKAQQFDAGRIRYCGSPLPLSFTEANYTHRLYKIPLNQNEAGRNQVVGVEDVLIPRTTQMMRIPSGGSATIDDVVRQLEQLPSEASLPPEQYPFLEVHVREDGPDPTRRKRIEQAIDGKPVRLASIKVESALRVDTHGDADSALEAADLNRIHPEEIFLSAHLEKYGTPADDSLRNAFREILLQETQAP